MLNQMERPAEGAIGSNIVPFEFEGAAVRIIKTDGEPWFVLADVCKVLDIGNPSMVASRLDDDEQSALSIADTSSNGVSQRRQFTIITESGLYSAIFLSRKRSAKRFKKWVTGEVLPSIRKTGSYGAPALPDLSDPKQLLPLLIEHASKRLEAEHRLVLAMADVRANDRIAKTGGSMCITDAAKVLQVRPCDLTAFMLGKKWGYRRHGKGRLVAHQDKLNAKLMEEKEAPYTRKDGTEGVSIQARVTTKGLVQLAKEIEGAGMAPGIQLVSDQRELELRAESKLVVIAPAVTQIGEPAPVEKGVRRRGKNRWTIADVCEWLSSQLADGPRGGSELRRLAQEAGLNSSPLYRACKVLGVVREDRPGVTRNSQGGSPEKLWSLPKKEDPSRSEGETSPNTEGQGHDLIQKTQGQPASWLSRLIGG